MDFGFQDFSPGFSPGRDTTWYVPLYCEENVFRFLIHAQETGVRSWGIVISNPDRAVALACQKSGRDGFVVWDYHVIALAQVCARAHARDNAARSITGTMAGTAKDHPAGKSRPPLFVFDLDSTLPWPCPLDTYLEQSVPSGWPPRFAPVFRLLTGSGYISALVSDRSHMRDEAGNWLAPPPRWPAPGAGSGRNSTLMDLVDMSKPYPGRVLGSGDFTDSAIWD